MPRDGTLLGALFESLATLSARVYAQAAEATVGHLRTPSRASARSILSFNAKTGASWQSKSNSLARSPSRMRVI
jgi:hypothetical protein